MLYPLVRDLLFRMDAEDAHRLACLALRLSTPFLSLAARLGLTFQPSPEDACEVWGIPFRSRVGMAAGFDKDGEMILPLAALGFGFVEVGTVTPRAQPGNPRPRLGRDLAKELIWNRMGFNNQGAEALARRISSLRELDALPEGFRIGINLGKNKDTPEERAAQDYLEGVERLAGLADYLVLNVSSPNTPGLRKLQEVDFLKPLLDQVATRLARMPRRVPCLIKFAPELDNARISELVAGLDPVVDGWVATNTLQGPGPGRLSDQVGGWSGPVLVEPSRRMLEQLGEGSSKPRISVGGVGSGEEAIRRRRLGASLIQLYSGWVYRGPSIVRELTESLRRA